MPWNPAICGYFGKQDSTSSKVKQIANVVVANVDPSQSYFKNFKSRLEYEAIYAGVWDGMEALVAMNNALAINNQINNESFEHFINLILLLLQAACPSES